MKLMLPLTATALLFAGQAFADCPAPAADTVVPNGSKATKEEMVATQKSVKAYDAAVSAYYECMKTQQDAEITAAGDKLTDDQRQKIVARYNDKEKVEGDKLQKVVEKFNAELRAWRAKNPS